jgi:hypothetical protein
MRVKLPLPGKTYDSTLVERALDKVEKAFSQVAGREEAIDRVLFRDEDGMVWAVTMTTAGALTVAAFDGKTRDV